MHIGDGIRARVVAFEGGLARLSDGRTLTADALADKARMEGVMLSTVGAYRVRACTHLDVDADGIEYAVRAIGRIAGR